MGTGAGLLGEEAGGDELDRLVHEVALVSQQLYVSGC